MADTYLTIAAPSEGVFREKMSKFLAFAHPVTTVGDAKAIIATYQKKYFDARHVCWAYMLGFDRTDFQSNDNGEPSGTAGKPILGQINSFNLTDVVIVVVRYFGGIKLGTPGLIAAYREAARIALDEAEIVERTLMKQIEFTFPYLSMNDVMRTVKQCNLDILSQQFDNACSMTVAVRADDHAAITARLSDIDGLTLH
ncbi:MAG: YigZ family protein [Barnesiella sp.]|nr:YigZ family protein [Bacteroidales bacterium]MBD5247846.1 YigZ family protein [Barnesiella sp.]